MLFVLCSCVTSLLDHSKAQLSLIFTGNGKKNDTLIPCNQLQMIASDDSFGSNVTKDG